MSRLSRLLAATAFSVLLTGTAEAADLLIEADRDPGDCARPGILTTIKDRFRYQVHNVPHLPRVSILDFRDIREHRYLPASEDWPIGRRYCAARVDLSGGMSRDVWYLIEYGQGFASIGDNVEFCVSGFDRWMVYNGRCRVLR